MNELSSAEDRVACLVAKGWISKKVAAELFIEEKTVKFHLTKIYKKLGVQNRTQMALLYNERLAARAAQEQMAPIGKGAGFEKIEAAPIAAADLLPLGSVKI